MSIEAEGKHTIEIYIEGTNEICSSVLVEPEDFERLEAEAADAGLPLHEWLTKAYSQAIRQIDKVLSANPDCKSIGGLESLLAAQ